MSAAAHAGPSHFDAVVIGGGVIGVTAAYQLRRAGLAVALVERRDSAALETSFANGGLITPSMSDPWAAPGVPRKILGWIGDEDAPFLLRLSALPGLARWGRAFLASCNEEAWRRGLRRMAALSRYSEACLAELLGREALSFDQSSRGTLRIFSDARAMESAEATATLLRDLGVECRRLDARECGQLEPALRDVPATIAGGLHYPSDQSGDCHLFTQQLCRTLRSDGASLCYGTTAFRIAPGSGTRRHRIDTNRGTLLADHVVLATAALPRDLVDAATRRRMPIYPVKGYSITVSASNGSRLPNVPIVDDARKVGINRLGDRVRLVGTAELCGHDATVTTRRIEGLMRSIGALFPDSRDWHIESRWAGLRPMTAHGVPYVGRLRTLGVWASVGHGHLGWTNACGAGALLRDLICGRPPSIDPVDYAPPLPD